MTLRAMKLQHAYLLLACLAASPALAQASASVAAGNISGNAQAGPNTPLPNDRVARGPRTDDTDKCDRRGVTVHSGNGSSSASASVSTSPGGSSAVAGGGSPGSRTEFFGCEADHNRSVK